MINTLSVEIAKLSLRSGDVLVVKCSDYLSDEAYKRVRRTLEDSLQEGIKILVLEKNMSLAVLTREDIESRVSA